MRVHAAIVGLVLLAPATAGAQRLEAISRAVHTGSTAPSSNRTGARSPAGSSGSSSAPGGWRTARFFLPYPYAMGHGCFDGPTLEGSAEVRSTAAMVRLEGGMALPDIGRMGLSIRVLFGAVELELLGSALVEPGATGETWAGLIGVRGGLTLTEGGALRLRVFGGLGSILDARGDASGFELGVAADLFPMQPLVISAEFSGGVLGEAGVLSGRASAGVLFGRTEVFVAWSQLRFKPLYEGSAVGLGGPLLGVRWWL